MNDGFMASIATWAVTSIISAGAVGGGFWLLLNKGLDSKLNQFMEKYWAELAEQLHKENPVFSRIDQQRADVIQKLSSQVCVYCWELTYFSPKTHFYTPGQSSDPTRDVMTWCIQLVELSKMPIKLAFENLLLLPSKIEILMGGWHLLTHDAVINLTGEFVELVGSAPYAAADLLGKRSLLNQRKKQWDAEHAKKIANGNNAILNELKSLFESVDRPGNPADKLPVGRIQSESQVSTQ